jgi:hypothetical protein
MIIIHPSPLIDDEEFVNQGEVHDDWFSAKDGEFDGM